MLEEAIKKAREARAARGRETPEGAKEEEIEELKEAFREAGEEMPEEYIEVLRRIDGYENNGYRLYGTEKEGRKGLVRMNEIWQEDGEKKYVYVGESDMSWYVYNKEREKYEELDKPSGEVYEEYERAEELAEAVIRESM